MNSRNITTTQLFRGILTFFKKTLQTQIFAGGMWELTSVKEKPLGPKVPSLSFLLYPCAKRVSHYE